MPADTILSTLIVLFTGEFLPKTLFKSNPNRLLSIFSPIAYLCYVVLWPISKFSTFLSKCLLRLIGMKMDTEGADEGFSKLKGDFDPGFFIKHYIKDMNIATEEGREAGADLSISEAVLAIYKDLEAKGLGDLGTQALLKHYLDV